MAGPQQIKTLADLFFRLVTTPKWSRKFLNGMLDNFTNIAKIKGKGRGYKKFHEILDRATVARKAHMNSTMSLGGYHNLVKSDLVRNLVATSEISPDPSRIMASFIKAVVKKNPSGYGYGKEALKQQIQNTFATETQRAMLFDRLKFLGDMTRN